MPDGVPRPPAPRTPPHPDVCDIDQATEGQRHTRQGYGHPDVTIAAIAAGQHGVVSRWQLRDAGLSAAEIDGRISTRRLHQLHRAVFAVGHPVIGVRGVWLAAVLAGGPGALLSHRSAAALHGLLRPRGPTHVTVSNTRRRHGRGLRIHSSRALGPADRAFVGAIPVTAVPRTLLDLAATADRRTLKRAFEEADRLRLLRLADLEALRDRAHGHHGLRAYRSVLAAHSAPADVHSELERLFLELCEEGGLPQPSVDVLVEGYRVDCHWPASGLVVELDGWSYHRTRSSHEHDHARTVDLELAGYEVLRFSHGQVAAAPGRVVARLRQALLSPARRRGA